MSDAPRKTTLQKVVQMEDVPHEKWPTVVGRTVIGTLLVALGVFGLIQLGMNHYLGIALVLLGATTWSTKLVTNSLLALVQPFKAFRRAIDDARDPEEPDA